MGRRAGAKDKVIGVIAGTTPTEVANFYNIPHNLVKSIGRRAKPQNLINNLIPSTGTDLELYPTLTD